jgi:hypothetical protein
MILVKYRESDEVLSCNKNQKVGELENTGILIYSYYVMFYLVLL